MSQFPNELRYTKSHEWVRQEANDVVTIGISDYAQSELGDLVFVELPDLNAVVNSGEEIAVVESVKTAADIYSPVDGTVIEVNQELVPAPEFINQDPYGKGWIFKVKLKHPGQVDKLMDAKAYQAQIEE
jgi:glycine cleavage system H protein